MDNQIYAHYLNDPATAPLFGKALLRDVVLTDILGADAGNIAYWEGKQLARRFELGNVTDIALFFEQAQLGHLTLEKQTAKEWRFTLTGLPVTTRLSYTETAAPFMLEAGFLAQSVEQMIGVVAETEAQDPQKNRHADAVTLIVHLDPKDATSDPHELNPMTLTHPDAPSDPQS